MDRRLRRSSVFAVGFLLAAPLIVACAWLHANDRWAATGDVAMIELRVRDVGTVHTPLIGLFGRFGTAIESLGSHPGPLSFYLLAPVYRLLGGSYWALRVATATLNAAAIACALSIANRRAGAIAVFATGLGLASLELGFGLRVLTEPWIPHVPILWFVVFLLAVWSVASDDPWMLPVAAASASLCAQTHIPYLAVCGGIGLLVLLPFAIFWARAARRGSRRAYTRAFLATAIVVAVLWAPPIIDEVSGTPGNVSVLVRFFANAAEPSVGIRAAIPLLLRHLDAVHLVVQSFLEPAGLTKFMHPRPPTPERGAMCLVAWVAFAAVAVLWLRNRSLSTLHGVVAMSLVVFLFALSRIVGSPWDYLTYGTWVLGACMLVATVSTATIVVWQLLAPRFRLRTAPMAALAVAGIAACAGRLAMDASNARSALPTQSSQLASLAPMAADALLDRDGKANGVRGRYLVTWSETPRLAGQSRGLVNELERRGLDVGVPREFGVLFTRHRVREAKDATAHVHLATGGWIDQARTIPGAVQIAYWDGRTPEARREFDEDRTAVVDQLRRIGRDDVAQLIDRHIDECMVPGMPPFYAFITKRMAEIGVPVAVFVIPLPSS